MLMRFLLGICCLYSYAINAEEKESASNWHKEMIKIDQIIDILTDLRNKELAKATWSQNLGDHLQFQSHNRIDAHYYWNNANMNRKMAETYQYEIDKFTSRKKALLEEKKPIHTPPTG